MIFFDSTIFIVKKINKQNNNFKEHNISEVKEFID